MPSLVLLTVSALLAAAPSVAGGKIGPDLGALPKGQKVAEPPSTFHGSDRSSLPERYPDADWVPLEGSLMSLQLTATVLVNAHPARAVIDTGASATVMSRPMAEKLGVLDHEITRRTQVMDAHGEIMEGVKVRVPGITLGARVFPDVEIAVLGDHPTLFLIGADLLQQVDLYLAAEEGLLGVFKAGHAPIPKGAREVSLNRHRRQLRVEARAPSRRGDDVVVDLIVDTGASQTAVPARIGINGGLPADIRFRQTTVALGGEREHRGRFLLNPIKLGPERVGVEHVVANPSVMEKGNGVGLLGNDVLLRQHTVISFGRGKLWLLPPTPRAAFRTRGPAQRRCLGPGRAPTRCIDVSMVARPPDIGGRAHVLPDRCLQVRVHPVYAGRTLELIVRAYDKQGTDLLAGGVIRAYATAGDRGFSGCFGLQHRLAHLGLNASVELSLRSVRTEDIHWPCDPLDTECLALTGPFADTD